MDFEICTRIRHQRLVEISGLVLLHWETHYNDENARNQGKSRPVMSPNAPLLDSVTLTGIDK